MSENSNGNVGIGFSGEVEKMKWLPRSSARLLELACIFGHFDVDTIHLVGFAGLSRSAAQSWCQRMLNGGWIQAAPLDDHRVYYRLTSKSVLYLKKHYQKKISRAATRPLSQNRKLEKHALLLYCTRLDQPRLAYRPSRDRARFEDIAAHIDSGRADPLRFKLFCLENETVIYFVVDRGNADFVDSKLKPKMFSLFRWASFERLAEDDMFRLAIAVTTENRRREIEKRLEADAPPIPWSIDVIPELKTLMPRRTS